MEARSSSSRLQALFNKVETDVALWAHVHVMIQARVIILHGVHLVGPKNQRASPRAAPLVVNLAVKLVVQRYPERWTKDPDDLDVHSLLLALLLALLLEMDQRARWPHLLRCVKVRKSDRGLIR